MIHIAQRTHTTLDGVTVIVLTPAGRIDVATALGFRLKLQECLTKLCRNVVVNLGQVDFIDDHGITALIAGMCDADKVKGTFRLCNVASPLVTAWVEERQIDEVFDIFETEEAALEEGRPRNIPQ